MKVKPDLSGVPETALWTLWFRAVEARRPDNLLHDPWAIDLVDRIDYPFTQRFGLKFPAQPMIQALRVRTFDKAVRAFLADHPKATVVALGEGLETQFWRVDNGSLTWLTVDLPQSLALRHELLPPTERQPSFAGSALDPGWTDLVDPSHGVIITAQGLLMYLHPSDAKALISMCAKAFPGGTLVFDALPPWMARVVRRPTAIFRPPPLPWTFKPSHLRELQRIAPTIETITDLHPPPGRGLLGWLAPRLHRIPVIRSQRPLILALHFRATPSTS